MEKADIDDDIDRPLTLAPKKDTWDLKRDLSKKLGVLDRMTNDAIQDLIRERLEGTGGAVS